MDLENDKSENQWRLIASPSPESPLQFTSQTWIYDRFSTGQQSFQMPNEVKGLTCLLYVFNGGVKINDDIELLKKDSLLVKDESVNIVTTENTDLVLFAIDETGEHYDHGMFSGNQL